MFYFFFTKMPYIKPFMKMFFNNELSPTWNITK